MLTAPEISKKYPAVFESQLTDCVVSLSYSHDDSLLFATATDGMTLVLDPMTGRQIQSIPPPVNAGAFWNAPHPTRNLLAIGYDDGQTIIHSTDGSSPPMTLSHPDKWVEHGAWSPCGKFLATAAGKKTHFWNAVGQLVSTTPDHGGTIADLRWHPQKEELAVAAYGGVSVWDANDFTTMTPLPYKGPLLAIGWSPDGQWLVSGNQDASLHIWPMRKKTEDLHMSGYAVKVRHLSWSRDSRRMACANLNHITVWDFSGKGPANTTPEMFETLSGEVTALAYHPVEPLLIAVGDTDGFAALYSHSIKNFVALRALDNEPVERLIWNHSGSQLAVAGRNGLVRVWKINLGK